MKYLLKGLFFAVCGLLAASCEMDNYNEPDATIQGKITDMDGNPLQVNQGASYIRIREISWGKGKENVNISNQTLHVMQDGTYRNTKMFAGEYLMLPYSGNFYPYDAKGGADDAGETVRISGTTTKDFKVTPYLTVEWIKKPTITADGYLECSVKFKRNAKEGYAMPDVREATMYVSRTINPSGGNYGNYYPKPMSLNNNKEGQELTFRTAIPLKYKATNYYIRVAVKLKAGKDSNYPGIADAQNMTTIEKVFYPDN